MSDARVVLGWLVLDMEANECSGIDFAVREVAARYDDGSVRVDEDVVASGCIKRSGCTNWSAGCEVMVHCCDGAGLRDWSQVMARLGQAADELMERGGVTG